MTLTEFFGTWAGGFIAMFAGLLLILIAVSPLLCWLELRKIRAHLSKDEHEHS